ncbi:putative kinase [Hibiscus syriacus]|uniref:Kinase n=1 Tax=Hibiscus syriacus TaxID=106335 RepID=A0A6A2Y0L4_HIBSY|nr:putative kinase [Hibiscus syriacus]
MSSVSDFLPLVLRRIEESVPSLHSSDYYMEPCLKDMVRMELLDPGYCSRDPDFVVGRFGYGCVKFFGKTDVRGLDLDQIVKFHRNEVIVYEDEINKPMVDGIVKKLRQSMRSQGAQFIAFDPTNGEWKFLVDHFSRYGLSEDDEEDIIMDDATGIVQDPEMKEMRMLVFPSEEEEELEDLRGAGLAHRLSGKPLLLYLSITLGLPIKTTKREGFKLDIRQETPVTGSHSHNIVDATLFMGRSFRVGWGPGGILVHSGAPVDSNDIQRVFSVINLEKVAIDKVVRDENSKVRKELVDLAFDAPLNLHKALNYEEKAVEVGSFQLKLLKVVSNRLELSYICRSYIDIIERLLDVFGLSSSARLVLMHQVMDIKEGPPEVGLELLTLIRRAQFSCWLQKSVCHRVQEEAGGSTVNHTDVARQLDIWKRNGLDFNFIEKERIRLYELLAGNIHGALHGINIDWKRFLGLLMWYHLPSDTALLFVFRTYQHLLDDGNAPFPVPIYIDEGPIEENANFSMVERFDFSYHLMHLHANDESQLCSLKTKFSTFSSPHDSLDYLPWCSHCNRVGHTKEKCFKLYFILKKNQKENKAAMISTTEEDAQDVRLTKTQLEALHKFLGTPTTIGSLAIQADGSYSPVAGIGTIRFTENFSIDKEQESGKMIGTAKVDNGLYIWNKNSSQEGMALSTSKEEFIMLWHRRLGHPNFTDLWGASRVKNVTGARWFITFIDDHTRFNSKIHTLRTDNGREYFNSILRPYLFEQGIIHQSSCPDTPQQNGVFERKSIHLLAVARALMFTMGIFSEDEILNNLLIIPQDSINPTTTTKPVENPTATIENPTATTEIPTATAEIPTAIVIPDLDPVLLDSTVHQQETRAINHTNEEKKPSPSEKQQEKTQHLRVYSRKHQLPETETSVPMPSLPDDCPDEEVSPPSPSIYLPIAIRKDTRSCTQHPIYRNSKEHEEALKSTKWKQAVLEEIKALEDNGTWEISKLPTGKKTVGSRLVAKGFTQTYGLDYEETFAPVAKLNTIRVLFSIAVNLDWPLIQLDVKNVFLNGELNEEVYMDFSPGFEGSKGQVCKLKKSLYGLKQSPRVWFNRFAKAMASRQYIQGQADHTLFYKHSANGKCCILIVYVDDIILTEDYSIEIERLKEFLSLEFQLKDLGNLRYFLGMEIARSKAGISISQRKYVLDLLSEVGLLGCKPAETPMEPNRKLGTDKDGEEVDRGRYQREKHLEVAYRILRYLKGTPGKGLHFKKNANRSIEVYTDAYWAGAINDRRSTSGYCSYVSGNLVTWRSKKQSVVARSSAEAEYRALSQAVNIAHNPVHHDRTKHVEIDRHFITEKINKGERAILEAVDAFNSNDLQALDMGLISQLLCQEQCHWTIYAVYFNYHEDLPRALEHILECENWQKAHSIFMTSVAHALFLSANDTDCNFMGNHKSEIENWDLGAGIYISFYVLRSSFQEDNNTIAELLPGYGVVLNDILSLSHVFPSKLWVHLNGVATLSKV